VIPEAQRRGIATEMARALVARAFDEPLVRAVRAHTYDSNPASIRVLERCGFTRVGPGESPESVRFRIARPPGARAS
jgi:RimJ/RimL family protein N-acetyltransferase